MVKVLRRLGVDLDFHNDQTCCGQPAFNSGFQSDSKVLARRFLSIFDRDEYIVCPSGSCTAMVKIFYMDLFRDDPKLLAVAEKVSSRVFEFSDFVVNVLNREDVGSRFNGKVTYHDSCHLLRELHIHDEPRRLIRSVRGVEFIEMKLHDECCGFGGTFSVKYPDISVSILDEKIESIVNTGADTLVSTDMGCLMHIGGVLSRRKISVKAMHISELLASE